jgi:hypothetical protein
MAEPAPETQTTTTPQPAKTGPKWEVEAKERIKNAIRRYAKPLGELASRDANEGDTRLIVTDFLTEGLGYDKYADLTTEYAVRGEFADFGIRIDKQLVAFIEVKRIATKLSERHLRQVQMYAVNEGVEWMVLTNGAVWQVWHLSPGMPVAVDLAFEVDLLADASVASKANLLFYLCRESLRRHQIDELWRVKRATSPSSLTRVILSDGVLQAARRELRRQTGHAADVAELRRLLVDTVLRPDAH